MKPNNALNIIAANKGEAFNVYEHESGFVRMPVIAWKILTSIPYNEHFITYSDKSSTIPIDAKGSPAQVEILSNRQLKYVGTRLLNGFMDKDGNTYNSFNKYLETKEGK